MIINHTVTLFEKDMTFDKDDTSMSFDFSVLTVPMVAHRFVNKEPDAFFNIIESYFGTDNFNAYDVCIGNESSGNKESSKIDVTLDHAKYSNDDGHVLGQGTSDDLFRDGFKILNDFIKAFKTLLKSEIMAKKYLEGNGKLSTEIFDAMLGEAHLSKDEILSNPCFLGAIESLANQLSEFYQKKDSNKSKMYKDAFDTLEAEANSLDNYVDEYAQYISIENTSAKFYMTFSNISYNELVSTLESIIDEMKKRINISKKDLYIGIYEDTRVFEEILKVLKEIE